VGIPLQSSITGSGSSSRKAEADQFSRGTRHQMRYDPSDPNRIEVRAGYSQGAQATTAPLPVLWNGD
jgi:hypothetical protein